ncbi:hypothetical protein SLW73_02650 [Glutamicibacter protophormiae]|uniref:hypothetical protein n=1 Tax=Glutamicibacter protophormiae TaxID=37930 RepID=UPI002A7F6AE7|nr:hypothetical protein [Glutamicibacter protophormiae]WPR65257.1 hypothetical protein SLW72_02650 [Glutamicibacter protophormiae]WPR68754.1 hypothetical protein SLW73_02650 [Glutamicibacter protophormiae]
MLAVSAFALVGCSASTTDPDPDQPAMETAVPTLSDEEIETANPVPGGIVEETSASTPSVEASAKQAGAIEIVENQFAGFAETRASVHSADVPDRKKLITALHAFCGAETPFTVSEVQALNNNLESVAESTYCDQLGAE